MAEVVTEGLSLNNPLFRIYAFYYSVLVLKMMFMSFLTGMTRFKTKTFANPEDADMLKVKVRQNDTVERIRRAHLNDIENIPIFFIVSLIYLLTNPAYHFAAMLIRAFTAARIIHTLVYAVVVVPQPARVLSWIVGFTITGYMATQNVLYFLAHLNDIENIPIFFIVSLIYLLTNPAYHLAAMLIRAFTAARIIHTLVYAVVVVPQPARGLSWMIGFTITGYMATQNVLYFL